MVVFLFFKMAAVSHLGFVVRLVGSVYRCAKFESFNVMRVRLENAYSRPEGQSLLEATFFEVARL